jgi:hypothetical protein
MPRYEGYLISGSGRGLVDGGHTTVDRPTTDPSGHVCNEEGVCWVSYGTAAPMSRGSFKVAKLNTIIPSGPSLTFNTRGGTTPHKNTTPNKEAEVHPDGIFNPLPNNPILTIKGDWGTGYRTNGNSNSTIITSYDGVTVQQKILGESYLTVSIATNKSMDFGFGASQTLGNIVTSGELTVNLSDMSMRHKIQGQYFQNSNLEGAYGYINAQTDGEALTTVVVGIVSVTITHIVAATGGLPLLALPALPLLQHVIEIP